jgi:hypothetical protein
MKAGNLYFQNEKKKITLLEIRALVVPPPSTAARIDLAERLFVGWLWFQQTSRLRN